MSTNGQVNVTVVPQPKATSKNGNGNGHAHLSLEDVRALMRDDLARSGLAESDMYVEPRLADLHNLYAPGYAIFYPDETGKRSTFLRFRYLTKPTGWEREFKVKARRYDQPSGKPPAVYFSRKVDWRKVRDDVQVALFITEGEKKSEKACQEGYAALGLGGAWNFKAKTGELLPALEKFCWTDRTVYIVYDSDSACNWHIQQAQDNLAEVLVARGAKVFVVQLPSLTPEGKTGWDDFLVAEDKAKFDELVATAEEWQAARRILRSELLHHAVKKAERLLARHAPSKLFQRGSELVRVVEETRDFATADIVRRPKGNTYLAGINALNVNYLLSALECVYTEMRDARTGEKRLVKANPPGDWGRHIVARLDSFKEQLPWHRLELVSNVPVLLEDGRLLQDAGYHAESGIWYAPGNHAFPPVPDRPTQQQARRALEQFAAVFAEFPFKQADKKQPWHRTGSYGAVLATIISILIRHLLPTVPLLGISAPLRGSGKTKIAECIALLTTGCMPARISYADATEFEKHLPVIFSQGDRVTLIDNIERKLLQSALLNLMLTTDNEYKHRVLGETRNIRVINRTVFIATGNQLAIAGDLTRRSLLVNLVPTVPNPEAQRFGFDPVKRAQELFPELVAAALTACRYYLQAGCPVPKYGEAAALEAGSFETWNRIVRGMVVHLGFGDPLVTQVEVQSEDPTRQAEVELINALYRLFVKKDKAQEFSTADIKKIPASDAYNLLSDEQGRWHEQKAGYRVRDLRNRMYPLIGDGKKQRFLQLVPVESKAGVARYKVVEVEQ